MMKQVKRSLFLTTLPLCIIGCLASVASVSAQEVSSDGSLPTPTTVSREGNNFTINGGTLSEANLFHSFREFSVPNGGAAIFANPNSIQNIISRVTGGSVSDINGLIRANGSANLFLLNPAGIVFGPNARLEIGGSFLASTASSLLFNGLEEFSVNPQESSLLSINIPIGLRFRDNPQSITNQSIARNLNGNFIGLEVGLGKTLALVGGNVNLDTSVITASGGRVELGGLAEAGTVALNVDGNNLVGLSFLAESTRADVSTKEAFVDVRASSGGSIAVNARNLEVSENSLLYAGLRQNLGSVNSQAGNIDIDATGGVKISGSSIYNFVPFGATGNSGNINITAESISLSDGVLLASNAGQGNAGNIKLEAKNTFSLAQQSLILSNIGTPQRQAAKGKVGNIQIEARAVSFSETSQLQASLLPNTEGTPGIVSIKATDSITFAGRVTGIFTDVEPGAVGIGSDIQISTGPTGSVSLTDGALLIASNDGRGNGGDLTIETGRLSIKDGSRMSTSISGQENGKAGNLFIKANELVEVIGTGQPGGSSSLRANVEPGGSGKGGDLTIETKKLVVRSAQVGTTLFGKGEAGTLTVRATDSVELSGKVFSINPNNPDEPIRNPAGLFAQINSEGEGKGGNLNIETNRLSVGDGAKVQVATFGQGDAGNLFIRASDIDVYETANADFFPGGIFAGVQVDEDETTEPPKGFGGSITIETDRLRVRDGARVSTSTEGEGDAGTLVIRAKESVEVSGKLLNPNGNFYNDTSESQISAAATSTSRGSGGSLSIDTRKLIVRDGGTVTVRSDNTTNPAGNLEIDARSINLDNQGTITATSKSGNGGDIALRVRDFLLLRRGSRISTTAGSDGTGGDGGNITINSPLIVAFPNENSDITANAFIGNGGRITIRTQGLFGIAPLSSQELRRLRPDDLDPNQLPTSDITAVSQNNPDLSGQVNINTPEIDPSQGLVELPETVIDPSQQIAQNPCQRGAGSTFVVTGRGGIPSTPNHAISSDNVRVDLLQPVASQGNSNRASTNQPSINAAVKQIVPAQGWIFNDKGEVVLTAYDPTKTGSPRPWKQSAGCAVR
jgi:filamentous hemagglutinin family protein